MHFKIIIAPLFWYITNIYFPLYLDIYPSWRWSGNLLIYQLIANGWNFNLCFRVWGSFHLVFVVRAPKKRCDHFWLVFWPENEFSPFSYTVGLLLCKNLKKNNCFDIQCVVEASTFRLNCNMTLESKENYPQGHTKAVQNSLGFMPEVKPLHKPRGDLVLCAQTQCCRYPFVEGI